MNKDQFLKEVYKYDPEYVSLRECKDWLIGLIKQYKMPRLQLVHINGVEEKTSVIQVWNFAEHIANSGHWKGKKYGYFDG